MSPTEESFPWMLALVGLVAFLLLLVLVVALGIARKLSRMEQRMAEAGSMVGAGESLAQRKEANRLNKQAFQEFLEEDPARRQLSKKDQFAAYRQWRQDRGLNWGG